MNINNQLDKIDREKQFYKISILPNLFFIFTLALLGAQSAYATIYYVSTSGNDANNGLTTTTPVRTIKQGLSKAQLSGDIVYVMRGTYSERNNISRSNITLSAYPQDNDPANDPIIDGSALPAQNWSSLISVSGSNNKVSGFEIRNSNLNPGSSGGMGIQVYGNNNTIEKINAHDTWSSGIFLSGDNNTVQDSSVWRTGLGGGASGLSAARGSSYSRILGITSNATIRRNKVFNNYGEALSCYEVENCRVEDNILYDNQGVNLYLSDAKNSIVQRNMIYISSAPNPAVNASKTGIALADERSSVPRSANNIIINNFLYNVNMSAFNWTIVPDSGLDNVLIAYNTIVNGGIYTKSPTSGVSIVDRDSQIRNNIVIGTDTRSINDTSGIALSHNSWFGAVPDHGLSKETDVTENPMVAKTGSTSPGALTPAFFKILDISPVIGKAIPLDIAPEDFFKTPRTTFPDIGGYQFIESTPTNDSISPSAPSSLSAIAVSSTQVNLTWKASIDNVSVAWYQIYRNGTPIGASITNSFTDTSVVAGTTYNYTVSSYDTSDNLSAASNTATVQVPKLAINSYSANNITANSATITWSTNIPANGTLYYRIQGTSGAARKVDVISNSTSKSVNITGLTRNTRYQYDIWAWGNGQMIASPAAYFTTAP